MNGKDQTETAVLDEDLVKEILEGEEPGERTTSRLVRLKRERDDAGGGQDPEVQD